MGKPFDLLMDRKTYEIFTAHWPYSNEPGADLLSPNTYVEFVRDYNETYFKRVRELGLLSIHYVGGDAMPRLEHMAGYQGLTP
jgi:hypothetical protein